MNPALVRALCALFLALPPAAAGAQDVALPAPRGVCPEESAPNSGQPLDLNQASEAELQRLPGIGPARARAIVAFREEHAGFRSVAQLLRVKGFGRATLRRLRPMLVVQGADGSGTIAR